MSAPRIASLELAASGEAITLARAWRIERTDGTVLGFTDHDEPVAFGGTRFEAASSIDAALAEASLGLNVETSEIAGALASDALDEADLAAGLYDGAEVWLFVFDWTDPALHRRMATYTIGEVTRIDGAFRAELRGLTERLERGTARRFRRQCDAELGDSRCGVDLSASGMTTDTEILAVEGSRLTLRDDGMGEDDRFDGGTLSWIEGPNAGTPARIVRSRRVDGSRLVETWRPVGHRVEAGDRVRLTVGCDKSFATCGARFANRINFRGFPYLPGNDFAFSYVSGEGAHDGAPIVP